MSQVSIWVPFQIGQQEIDAVHLLEGRCINRIVSFITDYLKMIVWITTSNYVSCYGPIFRVITRRVVDNVALLFDILIDAKPSYTSVRNYLR